MGINLGAEKKIVFLNTHKPSPVDQATVNVIGIFSTKKAIQEQLITSIKDVTGVAASDDVYKILQACFNGGAKQVLVFGKVVTGNNYKDLFDSVKNDWFGTVTDETELDKIALISKEIGAREKMLFAQVKSDTDIMTVENKIKAIAEDTTSLFFSKNDELIAGAVAGYSISKFAGSVLVANKLINGAVESGLTGAEQGVLDKNKANYMARMKGQLGLANGVTVTGDPIDYIHCVKALKFRLEEDITLYLKATPKPTFADLGPLKGVILDRCNQFVRMKALVEDKTVVDMVPLEEIPKNDILNGKLTGVKITVYYAYGIRELSADLFFEV
nr:MAG TPA: tail sheath protein [Caudoviricetes sp.]